jgi:hypothetical protein
LGEKVHNVKKNTESFVTATKENGVEVKANKFKDMIMSIYIRMEEEHIIKRFIIIILKRRKILNMWEQP